MRAVLTNFGSLGDVQPFVALAVELKRHGHQPVLAAAPAFRGQAEAHGLEFAPVGPDLREAQTGITRSLMAAPETFQSAEGLSPLFEPLAQALPGMLEALRSACAGADVLISGRMQPASRMVHDLTQVPFVTVLGEHTGSGGGNPGFQAAVRGVINPLRERLGLAPLDNPLVDGLSSQLVLTALSRHVRPPLADAPAHHHTVGYFFLDGSSFTPDAELSAFLDAGEPPVCIAFGSMPHDDPAAVTDALVEGVRRSGRRALLQHGWSGLGQRPLPPEVRPLGVVPYAWLFPRVAGVVHHGGAGTTGYAFLAGVPQVVVPHLYDNATWGEIVQERGCGGAPIPIAELTAERLSGALDDVLGDPRRRDAAATLGEAVRAEHGAAKARQLIENLVRQVGLSAEADPALEMPLATEEDRQQRRKAVLKQQRARKQPS